MKPVVRNASLAFANVVGCTAYLVLASRGWRNPAEQGMIPVTGEPFVWALCLPVLALFLVVDFGWAGLLVRQKDARGAVYLLASVCFGIVSVYADFAHH